MDLDRPRLMHFSLPAAYTKSLIMLKTIKYQGFNNGQAYVPSIANCLLDKLILLK